MLEAIGSFIPLVGGFIAGMIKSKMDYSHQQQMFLIDMAASAEKSRERAQQLEDKGVAITRRILALTFAGTLSFIVLSVMLYGMFNPEAKINVPNEILKYNLFSWIGLTDPQIIKGYVELTGVTIILPIIQPLTEVVLIVVGFYFGSSRK